MEGAPSLLVWGLRLWEMMVFPLGGNLPELGSSKVALSELPLLDLAWVIVECRQVCRLEACIPGPPAETLC